VLAVNPDAVQIARELDAERKAGRVRGPLHGLPVLLKDNIATGDKMATTGGSLALAGVRAKRDAFLVQRLRAAGAVILGKTNMTEFAFSGVGINPHFGTPGNAANALHIPGGSSSGAGVSVGRGLVDIAIGSDTGGSVRIPAAFNGVTGFKPTQARVSRQGAFPLSFTLDALGPLALTVADCAAADATMAGELAQPLPIRSLQGLRIGLPLGLPWTDCSDEVLAQTDSAIAVLQAQGAAIRKLPWQDLMAAPAQLQSEGTLIAAEAAAIHQQALVHEREAFDPRVLSRMDKGRALSAPYYIQLLQQRQQRMAQMDAAMQEVDLLLLPTIAITAPRIAPLLQDDSAFFAANALILRNTSIFNFYDLPAISLPLPRRAASLPVGLMLVGARMQDNALLAMAAAAEQALAQH
jgi:aspartyl-tRNA(Asn)/glutamyl-tRNA(Gln) amidotransferase subunit A